MTDWVRTYFRLVDEMDLEKFLSLHTQDCTVHFANNPPAVGHAQISAAIGGLWSAISAMRHEPSHVWVTEDGTGVQEGVVRYTTKGGTDVPVSVTSILTRRDDKIDTLRIYIDMAPVFEKIGAETAPVGTAP